METHDIGPSKVRWLAKKIEEDICARGLRIGEPYLTTAEAGRHLGISKAMAYRAMKLLVEKEVLVSHAGRGTFIGPASQQFSTPQAKSIRVFSMHDLLLSSEQSTHGLLTGLWSALPGYGIQFDFLEQHDIEKQVRQILDHGMNFGMLSAVLMLGCPRVVQEQVLARGIPAVVMGTDFSSTRQLPSVDANQFEIGRLAAEYLVSRGHRRIALLMREMWFPGDQRMYEGVGRALDDGGLGHEALVLRNFSMEPKVLEADLRRLLTAENRPTGFVCRVPRFAEMVIEVASEMGLSIPKDLEVISDGLNRQNAERLTFPSVCMNVNVAEQVAIGAGLLAQLLERKQPDPLHVVLPVELVRREPQKTKSGNASRKRRPAKT